MYIVKSLITIQQIPTKAWPGRNKTIYFDFVCEFEANDGWKDLTNQGKVTLPKKVRYIDENGKPINLGNKNANIGGFSDSPPTFLRGDEIKIEAGYQYKSGDQDYLQTATYFKGFISKVSSKKPFTLECEDLMWKLKQTAAKGGVNGVFAVSKYSVESMLRELFKNGKLPYTVNDISITQVELGIDFRVDNESIGQVLERLRKDLYLKSYFRGTELRCGSVVYVPGDVKLYHFNFQENIIDDDLEYQRKEDIILSAVATSTYSTGKAGTTSDGHPKTKQQKLQVLITLQKNGTFKRIVKLPGSNIEFPPNNEGERHDFNYNGITDPKVLGDQAEAELMIYYYTGFKGTFTTFGIPFVRMGDEVALSDNVLPERNGTYKVSNVEYKGGTGGLRQVIHLDYKVDPQAKKV